MKTSKKCEKEEKDEKAKARELQPGRPQLGVGCPRAPAAGPRRALRLAAGRLPAVSAGRPPACTPPSRPCPRPPPPQVKKAIEKGNIEGARIYAQNAIRKKNEARMGSARGAPPADRHPPHTQTLNYLKLGSRLDAVVSRLETQAKMSSINRSFAGIVTSLERALAANNLESVSRTMDAFERSFESLDVQSQCVEAAMGSSAALSTPPDQVDALLTQVAEEHNLTLTLELPAASRVPAATAGAGAARAPAAAATAGDELSARLAELKAR